MAGLFVICGTCQKQVEVLEEWRGLTVTCPYCGGQIVVDLAAPQTAAPADDDVTIGVRMPALGATAQMPQENSSIPLYFQATAASEDRKIARQTRTATNIVIRVLFSIIIGAALVYGVWFGVKKLFYMRSGFHEIAKVEGVSILASGHGFYLEAEKMKQDFSGNVTFEHPDKGYWITVEFKDGKAHGDAIIYEDEDNVRARMTFDRGRLISIVSKNGEKASVYYDFFGRPEALVLPQGDFFKKEMAWSCRYRNNGQVEDVHFSFGNGEYELQCTFDEAYFPHEISEFKKSELKTRYSLHYDTEEKLKSVIMYDRNGKKKQLENTKNEVRGAGPVHILFFRL